MKKSPARPVSQSVSPSAVPLALTLTLGIAIGLLVMNKVSFNAQAKVSELGGLATLDYSNITIANNNKSGVRSNAILSPDKSFVEIFCMDPDECDVTLDDKTGSKGDLLFVGPGNDTRIQVLFTPNGKDIETTSFEVGWTSSFIHNGKYWTSLNL